MRPQSDRGSPPQRACGRQRGSALGRAGQAQIRALLTCIFRLLFQNRYDDLRGGVRRGPGAIRISQPGVVEAISAPRVNPPHQDLLPPHSQPTAYCAHATQPTVPSAKRSQSSAGVGRRSAHVTPHPDGACRASVWWGGAGACVCVFCPAPVYPHTTYSG